MVPSEEEKILLGQAATDSLSETKPVPYESPIPTEGTTDDFTQHNRYNSPLFKQYLAQPITPVKISKLTIPEDDSINKLLHAASLVSKTQKTPEIVETKEETNKTNEEKIEEEIDERLLKELSVPDKRPSLQDSEKVLMENVVPGEKAKCY